MRRGQRRTGALVGAVLWWTAFLVTQPLGAAEPHPVLTRGFEANNVYDFNDIDHVNANGGNLVVTIPIGPRYPNDAGFEYGFTLVYNSRLWEYVHDCPGDGLDEFGDGEDLVLTDPSITNCIRGIPNPKSNAGTSWRLTLGELYDPAGPLAGLQWLFVDSSGAEHAFDPAGTTYPKFTRDSSYLRLRRTTATNTPACAGIAGVCMAVDHPDGLVYSFKEDVSTLARWKLHRIQDPFGNWLEITYSSDHWQVDDSQGRRHTVDFGPDGMVSSVTLAAFDEPAHQPSAEYTFTTEPSEFMVPGCPHDFRIDLVSPREQLTLLTEVARPDGSSYTFGYAPDDGQGSGCTRAGGRLQELGLPTGGSIDYQYGGYPVAVLGAPSACDRPPVQGGNEPRLFAGVTGVRRRIARGIEGNVLADTYYLSGGIFTKPRNVVIDLANGETSTDCIIPPVTFTDVYEKSDQNRYKLTRHFFDVLSTFARGLPRDTSSPDPRDPNRFRSSMVFDCSAPIEPHPEDWVPICVHEDDTGCWQPDEAHLWVPPACNDGTGFTSPEEVQGLRERYLEHESDGINQNENWRIKSENAYFNDSAENHYVETAHSDFDGFGHYRTTTTSSNSPQAVTRTTTVDYRPAVTPDRWLLELFDERRVTEGGQTRVETFVFDRTTGFLEERTTERDGGDLVATFTADASGNLTTETYTGGDPGTASYVIDNEFQNGSLSRSEYVRDDRTILRTLDATIDAATGLPASSRDASNLETRFTFDSMGRLTETAQQGPLAEAAASYTYTIADPGRSEPRASVTISRGDTSSQVFFDGLGRVNEERRTLPDGTINRRSTTFTPRGQPGAVTTLHDKNAVSGARETRTDYDIFGRPTRIWHADDGSSTGTSQTFFFYETNFKAIREIQNIQAPEGDAKLRIELFRDYQGRLVEVKEVENDTPPAGESHVRLRTRYDYDEGDRLVEVNQGGGTQIRTLEYDGAGLLTRECHPELDGGCIEYGDFDARGNPETLRYSEAGGEPFELDYAYDGAERVTQIRRALDGQLLKEFFYQNLYGGSFTPDEGNGKLFQSKRHNLVDGKDVVATVAHVYGGIGGRLSARTVSTGGERDVPRVRFTTEFAYDSLGNLSLIHYPDCFQVGCSGEPPPRSVERGYTRGLLTEVGVPGNPSRYAALTHHPNLTLHRVSHGNGVVDDHAQDPSQMQRPGGVEIRTGASPGTGTLWEATYGYDGAGNLVSREGRGLDNAGNLLFDDIDSFDYDNAFNRLVSATIHYPEGGLERVESRDYSYDLFGNLETITGSNPRGLSPDAATNRLEDPFTYDAAGNLTSQPGWDSAGNPSGPADWHYAYDALNMMTRAQNASGSVVRRYLYTADDERLAVLTGGRELWTLRGADDRVLRDIEYLSTGWRWIKDYVHGGAGLLATIGDVDGEKHYHLDHLGSPHLVTGPTGQILARHVYAPFGEELTPALQDEERMKFTGHERDDLDPSGQAGDLDYMHARFYSPWVGRFLSVDPIVGRPSEPQTWNRYVYARNNPIMLVDPTGRWAGLLTMFRVQRAFAPTLRTSVEFGGIYLAGPIREYQPGKGAGPLYAEHINVSHYIPLNLKYPGEATWRDGNQEGKIFDPLWLLAGAIGNAGAGRQGLFSPFFRQSNEGWTNTGRSVFLQSGAKKAAEKAAGEPAWKGHLTTEESVHMEWDAAYRAKVREEQVEEAQEEEEEEEDKDPE